MELLRNASWDERQQSGTNATSGIGSCSIYSILSCMAFYIAVCSTMSADSETTVRSDSCGIHYFSGNSGGLSLAESAFTVANSTAPCNDELCHISGMVA